MLSQTTLLPMTTATPRFPGGSPPTNDCQMDHGTRRLARPSSARQVQGSATRPLRPLDRIPRPHPRRTRGGRMGEQGMPHSLRSASRPNRRSEPRRARQLPRLIPPVSALDPAEHVVEKADHPFDSFNDDVWIDAVIPVPRRSASDHDPPPLSKERSLRPAESLRRPSREFPSAGAGAGAGVGLGPTTCFG